VKREKKEVVNAVGTIRTKKEEATWNKEKDDLRKKGEEFTRRR